MQVDLKNIFWYLTMCKVFDLKSIHIFKLRLPNSYLNTKRPSYNRVSEDKCYTSAVEPINLKISLDCARSLIAPFLRSLAQCELDYDLSGFHTPASLSAGSSRAPDLSLAGRRIRTLSRVRYGYWASSYWYIVTSHCARLRRYLVRPLPAGVSADTVCTAAAAANGKGTKGIR